MWREGLATALVGGCAFALFKQGDWVPRAILGLICVTGLVISNRLRSRYARRIARLDAQKDCEEIYHLLGCYEFPWEIFYGINLAFFRTFSSPTISGLYYSTTTIETTSEKRVNDTDILMHAWFDYGVDSANGRASWEHLNKIHGHFVGKHRNYDFVYVLCCFMTDTIRFIRTFGWRKLTRHEEQGACFGHLLRAVGLSPFSVCCFR